MRSKRGASVWSTPLHIKLVRLWVIRCWPINHNYECLMLTKLSHPSMNCIVLPNVRVGTWDLKQ